MVKRQTTLCLYIKDEPLTPGVQNAKMPTNTVNKKGKRQSLILHNFCLTRSSNPKRKMNFARFSVSMALVMCARTSAAPAPNETFSKQCIQLEVPLRINANNSAFDLPRVDSNIDAVDCIWDLTTWSHNATGRVTGVIPIDDTFTISAQLCVPPHGSKSDILQIATHGIGFDKR